MGWATKHPDGPPTGGAGANGESCTVTTTAELKACFSALRKTTAPYTVYVKGDLNGATKGDGSGYTIAEIKGRKFSGYANRGDVSVIGVVENGKIPTLNAVWLKVSYVDNIIIRNLRFIPGRDNGISKPEGGCKANDPDYCDWNAEPDGVTMQTVVRAWVDHCEFADGASFNGVNPNKSHYKMFDGLFDIKKASDYITISYSKFSNHDKTMLIGANDRDEGEYRITFFRNHFQYLGQRAPRVRFGKVHLLNNYYENVLRTRESEKYYHSYSVGLGFKSQVYSERNVFDIKNASAGDLFGVGFDNWAQNFTDVGSWLNGKDEDLTAAAAAKINAKESEEGQGLSYTGDVTWSPSRFYKYPVLTSAQDVRDTVKANAGVGK